LKNIIILPLAFCILIACSKSVKDEGITCFPESWLTKKAAELSNCTCKTGIYSGTYHGEQIYEVRIIDPLCNGINVVYNLTGVVLFDSSNQSAYQAYLNSVQGSIEIWNCSRTK